MAIVLTNALLTDLDPMRVESGELRIDRGKIVARGRVDRVAGDEVINCGGAVVMPGLVNGHTHLYSALATGMPAPPRVPTNFHEILELIWWRLDRALDAESIELSAAVGALESLRCGTTTLIDHHASPSHIAGSLDLIERGVATAGLRGVFCYEVTDRNGRQGRDEGLAENARYASRASGGRFAGLTGAHASFTLDDDTMAALAPRRPVHIHVAEDPCDERITRERYHKSLLDRLKPLLHRDNIFAHCIHLSDDAIAAVNEAGVTIAHNPRSNMNNAVGYTPIQKLECPVMLGTDGIGGDMFAEAKHAWFKSRDGGAGISPADVVKMLATSARRASQALGVTLGKLEVGAAADVVITDYVPPTPLTSVNLAGQFIFRTGSQHVRHVLIDGQWRLRDRAVVGCDEKQIHAAASDAARAMWERMQKIA